MYMIYVYMYVVESTSGPHLPLYWVNKWPTFTPQKKTKQQKQTPNIGSRRLFVQEKVQ